MAPISHLKRWTPKAASGKFTEQAPSSKPYKTFNSTNLQYFSYLASQFHHSPKSLERHVHFDEIVEQCVFLESGEREITHFTQGAFYKTQCRMQQLQFLRNTMYSGGRLWQSKALEGLTPQVQAPTLPSQNSNFLKDLR